MSGEEYITGFRVTHPDGPTITAAQQGDRWTFNWLGKSSDDRLLLDVDYQKARMLAFQLADKLAELEPYRREYEQRRKALALWVRQQVNVKEPADDRF